MAAALILFSSVAGYLTAGIALLFGASWATAGLLLVGTGVGVAIAVASIAAMQKPQESRTPAGAMRA